MVDGEGRGALDEYDGAARQDERLAALAEYAEIRARWLAGSGRPEDHRRRIALGRLLDRTGGVPHELRWSRRR